MDTPEVWQRVVAIAEELRDLERERAMLTSALGSAAPIDFAVRSETPPQDLMYACEEGGWLQLTDGNLRKDIKLVLCKHHARTLALIASKKAEILEVAR